MINFVERNRSPKYIQLYNQIKEEITQGTLKEGDILSGSRSLASTLGISRNTVDNAYGQLVAEGYIASRRGVGYEVLPLPRLDRIIAATHSDGENADSVSTGIVGHRVEPQNGIKYDLTNSSHTSDLFPKAMWKKYTLECMETLAAESRLSIYIDKKGDYYLRKNLRTYLERIRGVVCSEEQIIITSGMQQSLDFVCKLLKGKKSTILMEEPGYNKAASVFYNNDFCVETVRVDENGLVTGELPDRLDIGAIYCTPSHQFPTGAVLPIGRRYELLSWAKSTGAYILEDDFDSELQYYQKPIPSVQSVDANEQVIYLGTFSKGLSPAIRMGYMILPKSLTEVFENRFKDYNSTVPLLNQYVIGRLIETGMYDRHIRRLNHIFKKRYEKFEAGLNRLSDRLTVSGNGRGQYFLLTFSRQDNQDRLIEAAARQGVRVYSTMQFWQDKAACPPGTLFLGFSKIDIEDIDDCVERLIKAWSV